MIAGRIVDQLGGLRLADRVGGARHHRDLAFALHRQTEGAERITAEILAELGRIETELLSDVDEAEIGRMLDAMERIKARTEAMLDRETSK